MQKDPVFFNNIISILSFSIKFELFLYLTLPSIHLIKDSQEIVSFVTNSQKVIIRSEGSYTTRIRNTELGKTPFRIEKRKNGFYEGESENILLNLLNKM